MGAGTTIGLLCGSLRTQSVNRLIAEWLAAESEAARFRWIDIAALPLFNEDLEAEGDPQPVKEMKAVIREVDGVLIVSPEYNSGISGVLKNAIDWASRPAKASVLLRKPIGLIGATPGGLGTALAQLQTRQVLESVQANVLPHAKLLISQVRDKVDMERRTITDEKTKQYVKRYVQQLVHWIEHQPDME